MLVAGSAGAVLATTTSTGPPSAPSSPIPSSAPSSTAPPPSAPAGVGAAPGTVLWRARFGDDGLVTNERAHRHAEEDGARRSPDWIVTSGSLFASGGAGTSGPVDGASPDATSSDGTGSAVLRAVTRRTFGDVRVDVAVRVEDVVTTERTPARDYDGVHLFVRYSDAAELYSVDLCRRDGTVTIKRKSPDDDAEEDGSYTTLAQGTHRCPVGTWQDFAVTVRDTDAGVHLELAVGGTTVLTADDDGDGTGPALVGAGRVGVRGDNTRFSFRDLTVTAAGAP